MENKEIIEILEKSNKLLKGNIQALKDVGVSNITGYYSVLEHCENEYKSVEQAAEIIRKVESGQLVEVVHGKWNGNPSYGPVQCSICSRRIAGYIGRYCSACGAKMDGKDGAKK